VLSQTLSEALRQEKSSKKKDAYGRTLPLGDRRRPEKKAAAEEASYRKQPRRSAKRPSARSGRPQQVALWFFAGAQALE
jgi:hypothetical protein